MGALFVFFGKLRLSGDFQGTSQMWYPYPKTAETEMVMAFGDLTAQSSLFGQATKPSDLKISTRREIGRASGQIHRPVVAMHEVPWWVLEVDLCLKGEPCFPTDGIRRWVLD